MERTDVSGKAEEGKPTAQRALELLRESNERFRQVAEAINQVFWMSAAEEHQIPYISPGYERIWGRTCQSLYNSPRSWLDAIHPEDRQFVVDADLNKHNTAAQEPGAVLRLSASFQASCNIWTSPRDLANARDAVRA